MTSWFYSGRIVDVILAGMAVEAIFLVLLHRRTGRGVRPGDALSNIGSGACLLIAMRLALAGAWWGFVGLSLAGALVGHVMVLRRNWIR